MRDANGGVVVLVIIVFFIVIALGYLAFNVNYTKAFRMKDKIITVYEDFNGDCNSSCRNAIKDYAKTLGYNIGDMSCPSGFSKVDRLYCVREMRISSDASKSSLPEIKGSNESDINNRYYYTVITKINVQIPIMNNILDFKFFEISGDTKVFING